MNEKEINEINKYCSPDSLLVITFHGELVRLYCPFDVVVISSIDIYSIGDRAKVSEVKMDNNLILVYIIKGKGFYYYNFMILQFSNPVG